MFIILSIRFQHCTLVFNQMSVCWFMKWVTSPTRTKEFTPTAGACFRKDGPAALAKHQESLRSNDHRTRNRRIANVSEHAIISLWHLTWLALKIPISSMSQHVPVVCLSTVSGFWCFVSAPGLQKAWNFSLRVRVSHDLKNPYPPAKNNSSMCWFDLVCTSI